MDADGEALTAGLEGRPFMVKVNRWELERLVCSVLADEEAVIRALLQVHKRGVEIVVATRGQEGGVAVSKDGVWVAGVPRVQVASALGSGDTVLAGLVMKLDQAGSVRESLALGCAAGTATCLNPGTELCHSADVRDILPKVKIRTLNAVEI